MPEGGDEGEEGRHPQLPASLTAPTMMLLVPGPSLLTAEDSVLSEDETVADLQMRWVPSGCMRVVLFFNHITL